MARWTKITIFIFEGRNNIGPSRFSRQAHEVIDLGLFINFFAMFTFHLIQKPGFGFFYVGCSGMPKSEILFNKFRALHVGFSGGRRRL